MLDLFVCICHQTCQTKKKKSKCERWCVDMNLVIENAENEQKRIEQRQLSAAKTITLNDIEQSDKIYVYFVDIFVFAVFKTRRSK